MHSALPVPTSPGNSHTNSPGAAPGLEICSALLRASVAIQGPNQDIANAALLRTWRASFSKTLNSSRSGVSFALRCRDFYQFVEDRNQQINGVLRKPPRWWTGQPARHISGKTWRGPWLPVQESVPCFFQNAVRSQGQELLCCWLAGRALSYLLARSGRLATLAGRPHHYVCQLSACI